ncbi:bifunctional 2-polyprenyl-6-hydroxyphenol methylase/3-demethylubiquinol 3-O-methyltransferase UbiG [Bacillus cereus group sp. BfR-BA-01380]|uniref:class I SAM-dependent methyltransferase n=1 Tax=Bacillus cereus group sp. BfR-BA-01380 TaxID=2920324 RepID=UPI001F59EF7D|nr:class I SAM-dependent methyltransferase [Bacillus cereus group sp. BfR-BA-01380]
MAPTTGNLYENTARFYDFEERRDHREVSFYLERASKLSGDILEIACGTGRITLPLAQAGFSVWGIDLSEYMLHLLKEKLHAMSSEIQKKVHLQQANMTNFTMNRSYDFILIPGISYQALLHKEDQIECLKMVYKHLKADGEFIFNVFRPFKKLDETWIQPEMLQWEKIDLQTGSTIQKFHIARAIDVENQIIYPEYIFRITHENGTKEELKEQLSLKYYYYEQITDMIQAAGFTIAEQYGNYDGCSIEEGSEMIFVCRK